MAHFGCCVLLLSTALSYCRQDYVYRGFWQVVRTYVLWYKKKKGVNVGHPRHENDGLEVQLFNPFDTSVMTTF